MIQLDFAELYASAARATDALLERLARADPQAVQRRPCPRVWSAEEHARHAIWLEDTILRVESLNLEPFPFPEGFAILPGQVLEGHFDVEITRDVARRVRESVRSALEGLTPETLAQTVEDSGGRTVAQNLARYLELSAAARASALLVLRLVSA